MPSHRVAVVVPADFSLLELGVAVEPFAYSCPDPALDWYSVRMCTARPGEATAMGGLFGASITDGVEAIEEADTVIVPQAASFARPADPEVIDAIRRSYLRGTRLVSFRSGAFVLAAAGVLDGRRAVTHWMYARRLAQTYPRVRVERDVPFIDDGQVLTSAGTAAGIELSLYIIRKDHGAYAARHIARQMVALDGDGGQRPFVTPVPDLTDQQDGVTRAIRFALEHLEDDVGPAELAAQAFMSMRNFSRRFRQVTGTTPMKWLKQHRLARVCQLLEETDLSVERIAAQTGFGSAVTLRQHFAQQLLTSPTSYRRAFRAGVSGDRFTPDATFLVDVAARKAE